jgi:DNA-binding transcriptional MerR regulator
MKPGSEQYKPAEACKMAEVAPYVLRYWETEFAALSEGKEKSGTRLYSARDVRIISRIRELLYDEGFTVAGAKKRLDAEIRDGRFDDGKTAPPIAEQRKPAAGKPAPPALPPPTVQDKRPLQAAAPNPGNPERRKVIAELKDIVRILDRARRKTG